MSVFSSRLLRIIGITLGILFLIFSFSKVIQHLNLLSSASSSWTQTDWSGGSGQTNWSDATKFSSSSDIDYTSVAGQLALPVTEYLSNTDFETNLTGWNMQKNWWLAGGISPANVLAAYQPINASSYSESKSNLANPGTNDAIEGVLNPEPVGLLWTKNRGWYKVLAEDSTHNPNRTMKGPLNLPVQGSVIARFSNFDNDGVLINYSNEQMESFRITPYWFNQHFYMNNNYVIPAGNISSGVMALAYNQGYYNGSPDPNPTPIPSPYGSSIYAPGEGNNRFIGYTSNPHSVDIPAVAFYTTQITADQVSALTQSMNGLGTTEYQTTTKYAGSGAAKVISGLDNTNFTQTINVGDTNDYLLSVYAYSDGSEITSADLGLFYNDSAVATTYEDAGSGWYLLTGTITGVASSTEVGVSVEANKTIYLDDFSLIGYAESGVLTSSIFNTGQLSDWETLTITGSGSTIEAQVRTSNTSDLSDAPAWNTCDPITSGEDISTNNCVSDTNQYIQYRINITNADTSTTPTIQSISIDYVPSDPDPPELNAADLAVSDIVDETDVWAAIEPVISWTAGNDEGSGLLGYCIALDETTLDTSSLLDPEITAGALDGVDDGVEEEFCPFIATSISLDLDALVGLTLVSNKQYNISVKAVDTVGNIYTGDASTWQDLIYFRYDDTDPTNVDYITTPGGIFGNIDDMFFEWPDSGAAASSDNESGLLGWQYSINDSGTWKGTSTHPVLDVDYISIEDATYTFNLSDLNDGDEIDLGSNTIFLRTIDKAGNVSGTVSGGINFGGDAPFFEDDDSVTVTPSSNTDNSFAISWPTAITTGETTIDSYYYMINTTPPFDLDTLTGNSELYIPTTSTSVSEGRLEGSIRGSNTVYVVAVDSDGNYSSSNYISGDYTLDSTIPDPPDNLSVADTSIKSEKLWRVSLTWDEPAYTGTGDLTYIIKRKEIGGAWETVATTTGLSYTDSPDSSDPYYYKVGSYDSSDESIDNPSYTGTVLITPEGSYTEPARLTSGPEVTDITTKKAVINWTTARESDSKVQFGQSSGKYFDEEPSKSAQVTYHEINLNNLIPGTKYYYKAKWTDEDGNTGKSKEYTFTTADPPQIANVTLKHIGISSATLVFTVTDATQANVVYGKTANYGGISTMLTSSEESEYTVQLENLEDNTLYHYQITLLDAENEEYIFEDHTFTTLPRPRISNLQIQQVKGTAQSTLLVTWDSNIEINSVIRYYPEEDIAASREEVDTEFVSGEHRMILRGLKPTTRYAIVASGRDKAGNEAVSDKYLLTTATDTRPPKIEGLKIESNIVPITSGATQDQTAQLIITWTTDEPSTSQVEYGEGTASEYSNRTQVENNLKYDHVVIISNLNPSRVYHVRAVSTDSGLNVATSIDLLTITSKKSDDALSLVISNLSEIFRFINE